MNSNQPKLFLILGIVALLCAVAVVAVGRRPAEMSPGITFAGHGGRSAVPDTARISFTVVTRDRRARDAVEENARRCTATVEAIRKAGVDRKDIQTQDYSVDPWVKYDKAYNAHQLGYEVRNSVRVTVRDVRKTSDVIDAGVRSGSTSVGDVSFGVSSMDKLRDLALNSAIRDARHKAEVSARSVGADIGEVIAISEAGVEQAMPVLACASRARVARESKSYSTPISPGTKRVEQDVVVTFAVRR